MNLIKSIINESYLLIEVLDLKYKMNTDTLISTDLHGINVLTIPGFLANNRYLKTFNEYLQSNGCKVHSPKFKRSRNLDFSEETLDGMIDQIVRIHRSSYAPIYIVGHSLGGMYARAIANRLPCYVKGIITIGSPYMIDPEKHLPAIGHFFKLINDINTQSYAILEEIKNIPSNVKNLAIWSDIDGIVAPEVCYKPSENNKKITCSHIGMGYNSVIFEEVLTALYDFEHNK